MWQRGGARSPRLRAATRPVAMPGCCGWRIPVASDCRGCCAAAPCCTTRRDNAHRTGIAQEREVLYRWHPWAGCIVRIHEAVEKAGGTVLRCSRASGVGDRWLELPAWMFDRAACLAMRVTSEPVVEFAALAALQELLVIAAGSGDTALSSNTPVSSLTSKARNQNRGKDDAPAREASSATRSVWRAGADDRQQAGSGLASTAGRDATDADRINVAAPARPRRRKAGASPHGSGR